jgi:transaldolase
LVVNNPLRKLEEFGQSVWLDFIQRQMTLSGELKGLIEDDGLSGLTSNPTIFAKAIGGSQDYDAAVRALAQSGKNSLAIYESVAIEDLQRAADLLRPTYERQNGKDGFVSMEVSPYLVHDTQGTLAEARRFWRALERPNVLIKVPGTDAGLAAIQQLIAEGINVNVTLLFGLPRYRQVVEAYLAGLEDRAAHGRPVDRVASVASFFLSRIDTLIDPMLEKLVAAGGENAGLAYDLRGQAAIASAKLAYQIYQENFQGARWQRLATQGSRTQRVLWASTSTKNPAYSDVKYVEPLIGPDTINTMPTETIQAYRDHGRPALTLTRDMEAAHRAMAQLQAVGIDIDQITKQLEAEGAAKFSASFDELLEAVEEKRKATVSA